MACGGLISTDEEGFRSVATSMDPLHAQRVFAFAQDMIRVANSVSMPSSGTCAAHLSSAG